MKDLFLSTHQGCMIYSICLFEWNNHFREGKPTRSDKAELRLAPPLNPSLQRRVACSHSNLFVCHCFGVGGVMHHFLPRVCFAFYWQIDCYPGHERCDDGGSRDKKTQVAAPRRRLTSHTAELIKHDQYCPLPLYSFLSLGLKRARCQKTVLLALELNAIFLHCFFHLDNGSVLEMSEHVMWRAIQALWLGERVMVRTLDVRGKEKVRIWLSSRPLLTQSQRVQRTDTKLASRSPRCQHMSTSDRAAGTEGRGKRRGQSLWTAQVNAKCRKWKRKSFLTTTCSTSG